ncbi:MAG: L-histidine N(alpha)-methyltransferase [candidate division SR1 bacterium]|nr:L-histidine N(alpha)-methyltransferase [candidate division SR1 bacterium]
MGKTISDFIERIKPKKVPKKPSYEIFKTQEKTEQAITALRRSEKQMKEAISSFLESNDYSSKYDSFISYLKQNDPDLLDAIPREKIWEMYAEYYDKYLEQNDKNEFGLDHQYVDEQLRKIFYGGIFSSGVGDGSCLYAWKTSETNGIEKYLKVAQSELYKDIEPIEKVLYKFMLSPGDVKIDNILAQCKTLVELGPGGVDKLLMYLNFHCKDKSIKEFLQKKIVKLIDVNSEGYIDVKEKINKAAKADITEGIEGNFLNSAGSAYNSEDPLYLIFGGSIGNFSFEEIKGILANMKSKNPLKSSHVAMTYFTAPEENKLTPAAYKAEIQRIKAMYGDPDKTNPFFNASANTALEDFILSGLYALGIPKYGKQGKLLEYVVEYEEAKYGNPARIKLGARFKEDIDMESKAGTWFRAKKGNCIYAVQSARFTETEFKTLAKESGYKVTTQQSDRGVGIAMLESKLGINDKYKKQRNRALAGLIGTAVVTGGIANHAYQKNKDINEKIIAHEEKLDKNQSVVNFERIKKINAIKQNVCNHLMSWYDIGSLKSDDILPDISKYLLHDDAQAWLDTLYKNQNDEVAIYNFLTHFVNEAFYKNMFEQGSKDLNVQPFLQGHEEKFITTLQYNGPVKEGYNEKEGVCYVIQAPGRLRNTEKISGLENVDLTSGYMMKRTGKIDSIHIDKFMYDRQMGSGIDFIELSVSEPDADGKITIKRFFFDDTQQQMIEKIRNGTADEIVFENTHQETSKRGSSNLLVNKDLLIATFLNNNPIFKSVRERYDKKYGDKRSYMGRQYYADMEYQKIQTAILYDMYKNHGLVPSSTGEYTSKILDDYVDRFHAKYTKYKTSADALINNLQNTSNSGRATNNFPSRKIDTKSKGFNPGTFKK